MRDWVNSSPLTVTTPVMVRRPSRTIRTRSASGVLGALSVERLDLRIGVAHLAVGLLHDLDRAFDLVGGVNVTDLERDDARDLLGRDDGGGDVVGHGGAVVAHDLDAADGEARAFAHDEDERGFFSVGRGLELPIDLRAEVAAVFVPRLDGDDVALHLDVVECSGVEDAPLFGADLRLELVRRDGGVALKADVGHAEAVTLADAERDDALLAQFFLVDLHVGGVVALLLVDISDASLGLVEHEGVGGCVGQQADGRGQLGVGDFAVADGDDVSDDRRGDEGVDHLDRLVAVGLDACLDAVKPAEPCKPVYVLTHRARAHRRTR